ncbi:MAG: YesL family protein [Treponema sp.]|nr:YesL family protein [Treponema sp.]
MYLEKLFDAVALNMLWLLCCVPLVSIGASSTAFYYAAVKVIRGERGSLFREFWRSFKLNFVKATFLWIFFAVLFFIIAVNLNIVPDIDDGYFSLFLTCLYSFLAVFVAALLLYAFPVLSRFEMSAGRVIALSLFMVFRYFPVTLGLLCIAGGTVLLVYYFPLFIFFLPAGSVIVFSVLMEKVLLRHTPPPSSAEDAEYKWYFNSAGKGVE